VLSPRHGQADPIPAAPVDPAAERVGHRDDDRDGNRQAEELPDRCRIIADQQSAHARDRKHPGRQVRQKAPAGPQPLFWIEEDAPGSATPARHSTQVH
jgi:hypothetical protein